MTREQLLQFIAQIESNSGKNFNHQIINHGLNKGTRAIGTYGLTPATVNDIIKNNPEYNNLAALDPEAKKQYLESNPNIENSIAGQLVDTLQKRYSGDPSKIAYAWNHGTYINPNKITPEILQNDEYTNKFNRLSQKLGNNNIMPANNMPNNEDLLKKDTKFLPTIGIATLSDILNDPNNPFRDEFKDENDEEYNIL